MRHERRGSNEANDRGRPAALHPGLSAVRTLSSDSEMTGPSPLASIQPMDRPTGFWPGPDRAGDPRILERLLSGVVCTVSSCGWYEFPSGWAVPGRVLPNHVAFVCVAGQVNLDIGGDRYRVSAGEVFVTPPGIRQIVSNDGLEPVRFYTVHFVARLHGVLDMPTVYHLPLSQRPSQLGMRQILDAAGRIVDEFRTQRAGCALAANGDGARMLAILWREAIANGDGQSPVGAATAGDLARLGPVFQMIQQRHAEPLTLAGLAAAVHLEPTYFATIFKRVTGMPPHRYVAAYRLQQVRNLLITTRESITSIALVTGYNDAFYLSRVFRREEGMSPSAYRKSQDRPAIP